jgi:multimeric flavodoxin WrbA
MKVIAISGSGRKDGNTAIMVRQVFAALERNGIETELVQLAGEPVAGCMACYRCGTMKNGRCAIENDIVNDVIAKIRDADGIILASPTYFADCTGQMKCLIDRAGCVGRANGNLYRRKVGASVVSVRRAGAIHAFHTMNSFFTIGESIVVGSTYWNIGRGGKIGEVASDEESAKTMDDLGENMAWLLKKLHG